MKTITIIFSILACVTSRVQYDGIQTLRGQASTTATKPQFDGIQTFGGEDNKAATILQFDFSNNFGNYSFDIVTSDGFRHNARGNIVSSPGTVESYSHIGQDGKTYTVQYIAGLNGFQLRVVQQPPLPFGAGGGLGGGCEASLCGTGMG